MSKIIGNGLIANSLRNKITNPNYDFFATGVSNSNENSTSEFEREKKTLTKFLSDRNYEKKLVYFSTYSVFDSSLTHSLYVNHKIEMEKLFCETPNSLIIRLPNVIGLGGNPNTMFNYFKYCIENSKEIIVLEDAYRNILDVEDLICFINNIDNNCPKIINLVHPISYDVIDIIDTLGKLMKRKVILKKIKGGMNYISEPDNYVLNILKKCNVDLTNKYLNKVFKKYV
jgi:nucleoside-diphosphate-sugar epimerase